MTDYHLPLTAEQYINMETWAFNFRKATGAPMRIPPRLFSDLKAAGVNMKDMEPDAALDKVIPNAPEADA